MTGRRLHVGVMGAGSIGCYVGGRIAAAGEADVTLVGRPSLQGTARSRGLTLREFDREEWVAPAKFRFETAPEALATCDVVLVCVKSGATSEVGAMLATALRPDCVVVSLQNGVRNPEVLRAELPQHRVVVGVVGFNVVLREGATLHHTTTGPLVLETRPEDHPWVDALRSAGLDVEELDPIAPEQWTKLLVNLNNAISALSGAPTRTMILSPGHRRAMTMLLDEGLGVLAAAGIETAKFRGVPLPVMSFVLKLPTPLVRIIVRAQLRVDPESRASMWQDLQRHRTTEVDFLNGEIVRLAERCGVAAPLNRRIVELVHEAERADRGSPGMTADELIAAMRGAAGGGS
jgi:2-dehydropantoate 2-reductase